MLRFKDFIQYKNLIIRDSAQGGDLNILHRRLQRGTRIGLRSTRDCNYSEMKLLSETHPSLDFQGGAKISDGESSSLKGALIQLYNSILTPLLLLLFTFIISGFFSCAEADSQKKGNTSEKEPEGISTDQGLIREPFFSGQFYPSDPERLKNSVSDFLAKASPVTENGRLIALISPHAGYVYSGEIAAYSSKLLKRERVNTVILVGPSHRFPLKGASVWPSGFYRTPLGKVKINERIAARISQSSRCIKFEPQAHLHEHSLEVQIPFLQTVLGDFSIVPILLNNLAQEEINEIADEIAQILRDTGVVMLASTDLSHYHPYSEAKEIDAKTLDIIKTGDSKRFMEMVKKRDAELCGAMGVVLLLETVKKVHHLPRITLLKYANSGDTAGTKDNVVGYAAMSFRSPDEKYSTDNKGDEDSLSPQTVNNSQSSLKKQDAQSPDKKSDISKRGGEEELTQEDLLDDNEKNKLLRIARDSIIKHLTGKEPPVITITESRLLKKMGAFVTIHKKDRLRGCIGYIRAFLPLSKTISECAVSAAVKDPRFPPLQESELDEIDIEISVLTPLRKIEDINEIEVGKHGIYIVRGFHSGLLLPQVATENGWDRMTFLAQTCRKAGLSPDAWKEGTDIYIFSAQVFGEKEG